MGTTVPGIESLIQRDKPYLGWERKHTETRPKASPRRKKSYAIVGKSPLRRL